MWWKSFKSNNRNLFINWWRENNNVRNCKNAGADYIKTSTGFSTGGATFEDIQLFKRKLEGTNVKIKAAGGIKSFEDAEKFIEFGADRLGTSRLVNLMKWEKDIEIYYKIW